MVALVVTIILLLILAGITISQLTGSGLFEKAKLAEQKAKEAQELENATLSNYEDMIGKYVDNSRDTVTIDKNEYEQLKTSVENLKNKVDEIINKENNAGTRLLPITTMNVGQEYKLDDSIKNYKKVEIHAGIETPAYNETLWNYNKFDVENIVYNTSTSGGTIMPVFIASSAESYRVPHFVFTDENTIKISETSSGGWEDTSETSYLVQIFAY